MAISSSWDALDYTGQDRGFRISESGGNIDRALKTLATAYSKTQFVIFARRGSTPAIAVWWPYVGREITVRR